MNVNCSNCCVPTKTSLYYLQITYYFSVSVLQSIRHLFGVVSVLTFSFHVCLYQQQRVQLLYCNSCNNRSLSFKWLCAIHWMLELSSILFNILIDPLPPITCKNLSKGQCRNTYIQNTKPIWTRCVCLTVNNNTRTLIVFMNDLTPHDKAIPFSESVVFYCLPVSDVVLFPSGCT